MLKIAKIVGFRVLNLNNVEVNMFVYEHEMISSKTIAGQNLKVQNILCQKDA